MKKYLSVLFIFLSLMACRQVDDKQSLQGKWLFALDPNDIGLTEQWYNKSLNDTIHLPGSLQEQGYGDNVGIETPWTGQIVDRSWYDAPQYEKFRQPGNIKVPFWLNPDKHYVGVAWYQKEVEIPASWNGRPIELELERTHWETTLFLDGMEMGKHESLSTPYRHTFNELSPGKHTLTLRVDNRVNIEVGTNAHSVSDHTQSNWNGVIGTISLTAKPSLYIDDIQIYPNITNKTIKAIVSLDGTIGTNGSSLLLQIEKKNGSIVGKPYKIEITSGSGMIQEATLAMGDDAQLWSEHTPNLYTLHAVIKNGENKEEQCRTFGLREFKANGTRFEINGQPVFLRGTLECCIFPLTGYPAKQETVDKQPYITSALDNQAMAQLEKGENVLLLLSPGSILPEKGGNISAGFSSIFWNTAWTNKQPPHTLGILCDPKHPALAAFPTEKYSDYQWWDLVSHCNAMVLDDFPADYRPVVHLIDDWFTNRKLGILLEGKVGNGKLMVCSADLQTELDKRPAARQFRQSILQYMASDRFNPSVSLDPTLIKSLYK